MLHAFGLRSAAVATLLLSASVSVRAESDPPARAVIRGTGSDVTIVYRAPRPGPAVEASAPADPLAEAVRLKETGSSDQAVAAFLRGREADLPDVVDADVIRRLRRAGAGEPVIALVWSYAAVDIGETGEGSTMAPQAYAAAEPPVGAFPDLVSTGYPYYSGYGWGYVAGGHRGFGPGFGHRIGHHVAPRGSASFRFGGPAAPRPASPRMHAGMGAPPRRAPR